MIDYLKVLGTSKYINLNALCVPVVGLCRQYDIFCLLPKIVGGLFWGFANTHPGFPQGLHTMLGIPISLE